MRIRPMPAGAVAVLGACLLIQWQARDGTVAAVADRAPPPAAVQAAPPPSAAPVAVAATAAAATPPPPPPVRWRELADKLAKAPSLRAFYYEAVQRPRDGGYYYANQVLRLCKTALGDATASDAARQAQAALRARCDLSAQDHEDAWRHFAAIRDASLTDDPLLGQVFTFLKAQSDEARKAALQGAVELGNPEITGSLVSSAMAAAPASGAAAQSPDRSEYAMLLLQCRLGAACGPDSLIAQTLCARDGWCGASLPEALRTGLGDEFERLDGVARRAVATIRAGAIAGLAANRRTSP